MLDQPRTRSVLVALVPDTASQVWDLPGGKTLPWAEGQGQSVCPGPQPHLDATWMHPWPPSPGSSSRAPPGVTRPGPCSQETFAASGGEEGG